MHSPNKHRFGLLRHIGIVVESVEDSILFWETVFGLGVFSTSRESGSHIDKLLAIKDVDLTSIKLKGHHNLIVELLHFHSHKRTNEFISLPFFQGLTHIALNVDSIEATLKLYKKVGLLSNFTIVDNPDCPVKVSYTKGPEGLLLELVETK